MYLNAHVKKIIYLFFSKLINFNLFYLKTFTKYKYIYFNDISFGGIFCFYIHNYFKIKKNKILIFSQLEKKIAKLFFTTVQTKNIFFLIPSFIPTYGVNKFLVNEKYFTPEKSLLIDWEKRKILNKHKNLLEKLLKKNLNFISPELKKIQHDKIILLFIKHYKNKKNKIYVSGVSRHTYKFNKIFKLINFFVKKKKKIVILGDSYDDSIQILKNKYNNYKHSVLFFSNLSVKQSIYDQLFIHYYSALSIGSDSGAFIISQYLKKKILFFDSLEVKYNNYQKFKNISTLYKKIIWKGKIKKNFSYTDIEKITHGHKKYIIKENSFFEIKNEIYRIEPRF